MPASIYENRLTEAHTIFEAAHKRWSLFGNVRLLAAIVMAIALWQVWSNSGPTGIILLVVGVVSFITLAILQRRARVARDAAETLVIVNERAIDRLALNWDELPEPPDADIDRTHPYAYDLNIVGWGSVAQRIGTPATRHGWDALYASLLEESDPATIPARQIAIRELAAKLELRQQAESVGSVDDEIPDATPLLEWAKEVSLLSSWLRLLAFVGPALVLLTIVLTVLGMTPWIVILLPIALNTLIFTFFGGRIADAAHAIAPLREAVQTYQRITALISYDSPTSPLLRGLDNELGGAMTALASLHRVINCAIPRGSMLYFPLQMATLWDIHLVHALESWRHEHGSQLDGWLRAMGEWEALAALSVLTHDHPEWGTPAVDNTIDGLEAVALAHPLLPTNIAVTNDIAITPTGSFLFVTGSNMSGKSTLLRAIGVNVVLAQAGAAVCAQALTIPPLRVSSCMRVEDSLAHGVSFFMAELHRLKAVVDRVRSTDDRISLYLLDEILQGTNTAERQIASREVLAQLGRQRAIGAISSHDLELISGTNLEEHAILVHFAEQFQRVDGMPEMGFDYILRTGIATSSNAIRLMELLGFDIHE
ncbi:MAG: hypothetical protein KC435_03445 [Thermomicrobiales bacterium]|nr:hypothetical protein [Thermomicrobiales bacterium]